MKPLNLEGQVFGYLTVVHKVKNLKCSGTRWLCKCTCGNTHEVDRRGLIGGKTKSCGCKWGKGGKFSKGLVPWNKGKTTPEHVKKKQSDVKKGKTAWNKGIGSGRNSAICQEWRQKVLERDGHKCIQCNSEEHLHCDHIVSWKENVELRFEVSNGQTLCRSCHLKKSIEHGEVKGVFFKKGDAYWEGKKRSEETKQKISESNKGKKLSEETRNNMREGQIKRQRLLISDDDVRKIRELKKDGHIASKISEIIGVSIHSIYRILSNKTRSYVK